MEDLLNFFTVFLDIKLLLLVVVGTFAGVYVGAIPGLSVSMAAALLISFTFTWEVHAALALIVGVYVGGVYGGSRSAILLNIPGAPSAIATGFDGYPLAKRGEAGMVMGIATIFSIIGTLVGVIVLAFATPVVSNLALLFSPRDYFLLALLGLLLVGSLGKGSMTKAIFVGCLGVIIGLVGLDPINGEQRFTFGTLSLMTGVNFITAILGLFGLSEVFYQLTKMKEKKEIAKISGKILPPFIKLLRYLPVTVRSSIIGVVVGALPGAGGDIASLLAYDDAKRSVKKPERPFGEGAVEGVIAPETANNASIGGAFIPMLTLGIPGDSVTAIIIGALFVHGLNPGPMLMINTPDLFWVIVGALALAAFSLFVVGLSGIKLFVKINSVPKQILFPIIAVITVIGAYAINNSITDIYWMVAFGVVGFLMKQYGFPVAPLVLGIILGPILEVNFRRAAISENGNLLDLISSFFTNPISLILSLILILIVLGQTNLFNYLRHTFTRKTEKIN